MPQYDSYSQCLGKSIFLVHRRDPLEEHTGLLGPGNIRYLGDDQGLILFAKLCKLWSAHVKSLQENRLLKAEKVKKIKHFKAHNFKVGQLIAVKNHLRSMLEPKFVSDYRIFKIFNEHNLLIESPNGKMQQIKMQSQFQLQLQPIMLYKISNNLPWGKSIITHTCCKALLSKYMKQSSDWSNFKKYKLRKRYV